MSKAVNGRNGKVELLRFLFSVAILLFHICKYMVGEPPCGKELNLSLFVHGAIGVEFFFLVSGFLMAKTAKKKQVELPTLALGKDTWAFILRKYKGIWFYHLVAFVPTFVMYSLIHAEQISDVGWYLIEALPNIFLVQMAGISGIWVNHIEWYLSAMMIGMFLIYPLLVRYYEKFSRIVAPIAALLIVGYFCKTTGSLTGVTVWSGVAFKSMFRAIAELCLGVAAFELCEWLNSKSFSKAQRVGLSVLECVCYAGVGLFMIFTFKYAYEVYALFLLFIGVTLSFSRATYGAFFNKPIFCWLGEMSLPIYLIQVFVIDGVNHYFGALGDPERSVMASVGVLLLALLLFFIKKGWDALKQTILTKK